MMYMITVYSGFVGVIGCFVFVYQGFISIRFIIENDYLLLLPKVVDT